MLFLIVTDVLQNEPVENNALVEGRKEMSIVAHT
jgi:hypothetical protein